MHIEYHTLDFLGFTFKTRLARGNRGCLQLVFTPGMSRKSIQRVGERLKELKIHRMVHLHVREIVDILAPIYGDE